MGERLLLADQVVHPLWQQNVRRPPKENRERIALQLRRTRSVLRGSDDPCDGQLDRSRTEVDAVRATDEFQSCLISQGGKNVFGHRHSFYHGLLDIAWGSTC